MAQGVLGEPDDLLDGAGAPRAGLDRGVVGHQGDRPAVDGANRLVVLVDDEPLVLEALKETFAAWEFEVLAGDTADGVLERLGVLGRRPDVIVADYQLGHGRTGIEVVLDARATPAMALRMDRAETLEQELFVLQIMGDDRSIRQTYVAGRAMKTAG